MGLQLCLRNSLKIWSQQMQQLCVPQTSRMQACGLLLFFCARGPAITGCMQCRHCRSTHGSSMATLCWTFKLKGPGLRSDPILETAWSFSSGFANQPPNLPRPNLNLNLAFFGGIPGLWERITSCKNPQKHSSDWRGSRLRVDSLCSTKGVEESPQYLA